MLKRMLVVTILGLLVTISAIASDREDDVNRTHKAAQVFKEIMDTPESRRCEWSNFCGEPGPSESSVAPQARKQNIIRQRKGKKP